MLCPYCSSQQEHHPRCPLGPALAPSEDGSCHCGATVLSTDSDPCLFCGGFTREQLETFSFAQGREL